MKPFHRAAWILVAITGTAWTCHTQAAENADTGRITEVVATTERLVFRGIGATEPARIVELGPLQSEKDVTQAKEVAKVAAKQPFETGCARFDAAKDRLYSGFLLIPADRGTEGSSKGAIRHVENAGTAAKFTEPFPQALSKKGLQVQMVDDALALGVKHAALNVNLAGMIDPSGDPTSATWQVDGTTHHFRRGFLESIDRQVKPLSDAGVVVSFILLVYETGDPAINTIMLHPRYDRAAPNKLGAFNTATPEGLRWFKACIEFLADRYSRPDRRHGRAVNFIVGNEVNSHWEWANMGRVTMEDFAGDYLRTVRLCHTAVRKMSSSARVYLSLEHHWGIRYDRDPLKSFEGRRFLDFFAAAARDGGDFDWNLAYHPYPENLFECRFWKDQTATPSSDTPRITFKNLEVLVKYLRQPQFLHRGQQRRIILSEQGFHSPATPEGEQWQAAAYCYAYFKVAHLDGIDSFILHRHVDHGREGGLNLGLWARNPASANLAEPLRKKPIYPVFRAADQPGWESAFEFALPIIGIKSWNETLPAPAN